MEILKITDEVYNYYRENVRGNENITRDQAARKLTRNVLLAMPVSQRNFLEMLIGNQKYIYGNLHIICRRNRVVHMYNHQGGKPYGGWKADEQKYIELTKELGIE